MGWEEAGDHGLRKEDRSYFLRRAWVCDLPWKLLIRFAAGEAPPSAPRRTAPVQPPEPEFPLAPGLRRRLLLTGGKGLGRLVHHAVANVGAGLRDDPGDHLPMDDIP